MFREAAPSSRNRFIQRKNNIWFIVAFKFIYIYMTQLYKNIFIRVIMRDSFCAHNTRGRINVTYIGLGTNDIRTNRWTFAVYRFKKLLFPHAEHVTRVLIMYTEISMRNKRGKTKRFCNHFCEIC